MAPSNSNPMRVISERQTNVGEYNLIRPRRRNNSQSNSNAIAAAEAAASYILSNGPVIKKKKDKGSPTTTSIATMSSSSGMVSRGGGEGNYSVIRSRSFSSSNNDLSTNGNNNNIHHNDNSNNNVSNNNSNNIRGSSFIVKMQRQREIILQKGRRRRQSLGGGFYHGSSSSRTTTTALLSSKKIIMILIFFILGILFIYEEEGYQYHQDQTNVNHNSNSNKQMLTAKKNKVKDSSKNNVSIERRKGFVATFVRGSHPHDNNDIDEQQHSSSSDAEEEEVVVKSPIVEAPSSNNAAAEVVDNNEENNVENVDDDAIIKQPVGNHNHIIPSTLIFTYHTNLLTTPISELNDEEDVALSNNVKQIISLHNNNNNSTSSSTTNNNIYSNVRFLNDDDCIKSIKYALGPDTNLTTYFINEEHGMYKADICRGAALYESGGLYFDIDIEARMSIWNVISPNTEFVTTFVHKDSNHIGGFFQAFIGVIPQSTIMKRYLELFVLYYEGELNVNGPLGVYFLRMAYDAVIGKTHNENDDGTIDLWQEVRYTPQRFPYVNRERWGKRRACQMLVVAKSIKVEGFEREEMVPLFSHANGSRMCGGKDTYKKG